MSNMHAGACDVTLDLDPTLDTILRPDPRLLLRPGDVTDTWCSQHGRLIPHLWDGHALTCLICHPERDPEREESKG
jgi:hypothetical protein